MRLLGLVLCIGALATPAWGSQAIRDALAASDTKTMAMLVVEHYERGEARFAHPLRWRFEAFDYIFNYFDVDDNTIVLGSIPTPEQTQAYWQNWSDSLTEGRWQPQAFFGSEGEAFALAGFNQLVLAAHEAAHAMTYRHDPGHLARHDYEINCREFYADRLMAAWLDELAEADPELAGLRVRYLELIMDIEAQIAQRHRYKIKSLEALENNCALIHVVQPTPTTLQPYGSAYFLRQFWLLQADMPPLEAFYEQYLFNQPQ